MQTLHNIEKLDILTDDYKIMNVKSQKRRKKVEIIIDENQNWMPHVNVSFTFREVFVRKSVGSLFFLWCASFEDEH